MLHKNRHTNCIQDTQAYFPSNTDTPHIAKTRKYKFLLLSEIYANIKHLIL